MPEAADLPPLVPEQAVVPDLPVVPKASPLEAVATPTPLPDAPSVQLAGAKKLPAAQTFLESLKTPAAPAVGGPDWAKFPGGKGMPSQAQWLANVAKAAPKAKLALIGRDMPPPADLIKMLADKDLPPEIRTTLQDQLDEGYSMWQSKVAKDLPKLDVETTNRQMGTFQQVIKDANVRAEAERALGPELVGWLERKRNPNSFDKTINEVKNILENQTQLDTIIDAAKMSSVMKSLMTHMGVDVVETNKNIKILSSASKVPVTPEDMLGKMDTTAEERLANLDQDALDLIADLPGPIEMNFGKVYDKHTKTGIGRDSNEYAMGLGRAEKVFNQYTMWDVEQSIMARVITRVDKLVAKGDLGAGVPRALAIKEEMVRKRALASDMFDQEGYQMYLGIKDNTIPLNLDQMYGILDNVGGPGGSSEAMLKFLYNTGTRAPTTNIMDGLVHAAEGASRDVVRADIANVIQRNVSPAHMLPDGTIKPEFASNYRLPNPMVDKGSKRIFGFIPNTGYGPPKKIRPGVTYVAKGNAGWYRVYSPDALVDELTDIVMGAGPEVRRVGALNAQALKDRGASEIADLTTKEVTTLLAKMRDPERVGEALRQAGNIDGSIAKSVRDAGALGTSEIATKAAVAKLIDQDVADSAASIVKAGDKAKQAGRPANTAGKSPEQVDKQVQKASRVENQKGAGAAIDAARQSQLDMINKAAPIEGDARAVIEQRAMEMRSAEMDISAETYNDAVTAIGRIFEPAGRIFKNDHQMKNVYEIMQSFGNTSNLRRGDMLVRLNKLAAQFGGKSSEAMDTTILSKAMTGLQKDMRSADPLVQAAQDGMRELLGPLLSGGKNSIIENVYFRSSASIDQLNSTLTRVGIEHQIDIGDALRRAKENDSDMLTEAIGQWKTWGDIAEDPLNFMSKLYVAAEMIATDAGVAQTFVKRFGSTTWSPGKVRLTASGDSRYIQMIDKDMYFDKDLAHEFAIMDKVSRMSSSPDGEIGRWVKEIFDPLQGAWKFAITLPRPGHHVRNMVGDMSMTFVAEGVKFAKQSGIDAFKVLGLNKRYDGLDYNRALEHVGETTLPTGTTVLSKGKYGDMEIDQILQAGLGNGLFNSVHMIEDLADVSSPLIGAERVSTFARTVNKAALRGGPIEKIASSISEGRDHYVRMQHFLQYIYKSQASGVDHLGRAIKGADENARRAELFRLAANQVKKHHPDGSMLTPFERKYMRRIMPFYSWMRGAIPAVIESAVLHPGRAMVFPKASYNLAVSMGINPDSLSEPFPADQMFPSFLTEKVFGPQFQLPDGTYLNMNPGIAGADVLNMLAPDPVRGIAGAISPLIRMPAELLAGGTWGTGAPIKDASDYIDGAIPGINYVSNISGSSVTGSVASLIQGKGLDPQAQVAAGNKGPLDQGLSALNFVTGAGVNNQSRQNYVNYAEIEKRNREGGQSGNGF